MTKAAYAEYLQSPHWLALRQLILRRAGGMCEHCRGARATQVHHLTYERLGCEWLTDLVALCKDCHEQEHDDEFKTMFARLLEMSDEEVRELMHLPQSH